MRLSEEQLPTHSFKPGQCPPGSRLWRHTAPALPRSPPPAPCPAHCRGPLRPARLPSYCQNHHHIKHNVNAGQVTAQCSGPATPASPPCAKGLKAECISSGPEQEDAFKDESMAHSKSSIKASYCNCSKTRSSSSKCHFIQPFSTSPRVGSFNGNRGLHNLFSQSHEVLRNSRKWISTAFPQISLTRSFQEKERGEKKLCLS